MWTVVDIYRTWNQSTIFRDIDVNNCFSIYHTSWITSGLKNNCVCDNIPTKFFGCSEMTSTWLISNELANQRVRKVLFIFACVVYTNSSYFVVFSVSSILLELRNVFCIRTALNTQANTSAAHTSLGTSHEYNKENQLNKTSSLTISEQNKMIDKFVDIK